MVQNMNGQRERDDLLGIGNAINTSRQEYNNGLTNTVQSGLSLASAVGTMSGGTTTTKTNTITGTSGNAVNTNLNYGKPQGAIQSNLYNQQISDYNQQISDYNKLLYRTGRRF